MKRAHKTTVLMRIAAAGALALLVLVTTTPALSKPLELPELAEQTKPAVVHLKVFIAGEERGSGSGFVVSDDGLVVTNHHVIDGASKVVAKLSDGREVEVVGLLAADAERDVAVLKLAGGNFPKPLELGSSETLRQGDKIVVIGSPRGLSHSLSAGIVSAKRGEGIKGRTESNSTTRAWEIQITAAISPGSSGSPIMMYDGKVVAVAVGIMQGEQGLGFGVPIESVKDMLGALDPNATPTPFGSVIDGSTTNNLLISAGFFGAIALAFFVGSRIQRYRESR